MRPLQSVIGNFTSIGLLVVFGLSLLIPTGVGLAQARGGKGGPMGKVSNDLTILYDEYVSYLEQGSDETFKPSNPLLRVIEDRVVIDAVASGDAGTLQSDLEALGMPKVAAFGRMVSGQIPIRAIKGMAGLESLKFARPVYAATRRGSIGLGTQQAPTRGLPIKKGAIH